MASYVIVAPVYNGAATLLSFFREIENTHLPVEVVISDDASTDDSVIVAEEFTSHFVIANKNTGVGGAVKRGLAYAATRFPSARFVIKIDTDGQHRVEYLPRLIEKLEEGFDLVCMSRFHPESEQIETPFNRKCLNETFARILGQETGWSITDSRTGFMGFSMVTARMLAERMIVEAYGVPIEILLRVHATIPTARFLELPHPAVYGGETIMPEHRARYQQGGESEERMAQRWKDAAQALFRVRADLGLTN